MTYKFQEYEIGRRHLTKMMGFDPEKREMSGKAVKVKKIDL
jgi:hypothetical protein